MIGVENMIKKQYENNLEDVIRFVRENYKNDVKFNVDVWTYNCKFCNGTE